MFYREDKQGVTLFIRLTPKSSKDLIESVVHDAEGRQYLAARVRAVPEKGLANKALEKLVSKTFAIPLSQVEVVSGSTSRLKQVLLHCKLADIAEKLDQFSP